MLIAIITSFTGFVLCSVLAATMFMFWKSYHIWKNRVLIFQEAWLPICTKSAKQKHIQTSSTVLIVAASHVIKGKISKNRAKTIFVPSHKLDFWTF